MSLPTDPFAAPSTAPQAVVLRRAAAEPDARRTRPALIAGGAVGLFAVGATVTGVVLTTAGPPAAPAALAPSAGAAATLVPPLVGAPIVPTEVAPPVVTTRERPAARTTRTTPERRPRTVSPQVRDAREIVAVVRERIAQAREEARERARSHRHGPHHR
ncbi:hypothetical protein [Actinomycetospora soli]|uniref:hypothetical protein n=1 Tax=Actinomycetospora soli TaxID=2893887 RepID=UPI001E49CCD6|nr:hypothetical protein [Actinomycetospora soli]MCD2189196.1 hypothetical protein [Actinomycetospora soli]